MTNRTHTGFLLVVLTAGLASCEGAGPPPTAPSIAQPQQPPGPASNGPDTYSVADVTLSGVVYEVTPGGRVPIEGVRVQPDYFHVFPAPEVVTDAQGVFSFRPIWVCPCSWDPSVGAGVTAVRVDKEGYESPAGQPASVFGANAAVKDPQLRDVTINGNTRFDIELVKR